MFHSCPNSSCSHQDPGLKSRRIGWFYRKSDGQYVRRFICMRCKRSFSLATGNPCFGQNKRQVNAPLFVLLNSGVSQNRCARIFKVHRNTIARKQRFLAKLSRENQSKFLKGFGQSIAVQMDDLETSIHTKCKPVSVTLAVDAKTRILLGFEVSIMPAKGLLAKIAKEKYGYRPDERVQGIKRLLGKIQGNVHERAEIKSDQNPLYPSLIKRFYPKSTHKAIKGVRGSSTGQGELKKIGFDPLFSLNHTCAMMRANISRLIRKTWCTSKKISALEDHLAIYMDYHNRVLVLG